VSEIDTTQDTETDVGWLDEEDMAVTRSRMPIVYVDAVPVRVDTNGNVTEVGMLLRVAPDGNISRTFISGRVLYGERVRDALLRHCEKDLGPLALPRLPVSPAPFTVAEYFPDPNISGFYDPRQHAVSLAYVVPVDGECQPTQKALDLSWFTPSEAVSDGVRQQMTSGHDRLIRLALAHVAQLP
jgi:ADP-ribose pyrophosphatase YjhB (NUDIX family)